MMPAGGSIVALSSLGAARAMPGYGFIGASKAALESLVRTLAQELGPRGIRVNTVSAGVVDTDALSYFPNREELLENYAKRTPLGPTLGTRGRGRRRVSAVPARVAHDHRPHADRGRRILHFRLKGQAMDSGIAGKSVLVTGGSRGIGRAIVELFAAEGADVTFLYRGSTDAAAAVTEAARAAGQLVTAEQADVCDAEACAAVVERMVERCGRIDVLVNNAGVIRDNLLGFLSPEDVQTVLDTNVVGVFNVTRAVVPHMISKRAGRIINVSSVAGDKGGRGQSNYAASKGAINAFTRAMAVELAPRRIRVNAVAPGVIETEMSQAVREAADDEVKSRILLRRYGTPGEVAYAVWFLASTFAEYITGQVLHVDGGFKME